ncbi:MAG: GIY-YIG nuclease family protein [Desulfovibrionaceae bacterium]
MQSSERKARVAAYKERKVVPGIFALRCEAAGLVWVGRAPEVATIRNRLWFSLRTGGYPRPDVQRA